jgi:hypothetical protein
MLADNAACCSMQKKRAEIPISGVESFAILEGTIKEEESKPLKTQFKTPNWKYQLQRQKERSVFCAYLRLGVASSNVVRTRF